MKLTKSILAKEIFWLIGFGISEANPSLSARKGFNSPFLFILNF
jgi:hypothetical protein